MAFKNQNRESGDAISPNHFEKRIVWIDYAKSIAIWLVVLLHTHCDAECSQIINSFVMPTFFILSGILFSSERYVSYGQFIYGDTTILSA